MTAPNDNLYSQLSPKSQRVIAAMIDAEASSPLLRPMLRARVVVSAFVALVSYLGFGYAAFQLVSNIAANGVNLIPNLIVGGMALGALAVSLVWSAAVVQSIRT